MTNPDEIAIVRYAPQWRQAFRDINVAWITKDFALEAEDLKLLENPEEILAYGGMVFFAIEREEVLGTAALINHGGEHELAKMCVKEPAQGQGIGELLCRTVIDCARELGVTEIVLGTNRALAPARRYTKSWGSSRSRSFRVHLCEQTFA